MKTADKIISETRTRKRIEELVVQANGGNSHLISSYFAIFIAVAFFLATLVLIGYGIWFLTLLPWALFINWSIQVYDNIPTFMMPFVIAFFIWFMTVLLIDIRRYK